MPDGRPVTGARVWMYPNSGGTTDEFSFALMSAMASGRFLLRLRREVYEKRTLALLLAALLGLTACGAPVEKGYTHGEIFIYGEEHANASCLDKELALWQTFYGQGMRHLFIEMGAGSTLLLNRWMAAEDDAYWDMVYGACEGTLFHAEVVADFYHQIKETCPDTIFHGFDIEHQYATSGEKARQLLEDEGKTDTDGYRAVERSIKQGVMYYRRGADDEADVQREYALANNFCTAFDALGGISVVAFCGGAHADPNGMDHQTGTVPSMAAQIAAHYGSKVTLTCANLAREEKPKMEPLRTDTLTIAGKSYTASYFGEQDISDWSDYASREFWRVEGGYDAFPRGRPREISCRRATIPWRCTQENSMPFCTTCRTAGQCGGTVCPQTRRIGMLAS